MSESDFLSGRRQVTVLGLGLPTAVGEAGASVVQGCGRAPGQGRGLFQNRHIAHPNLPAPFPAANSQWSLCPQRALLWPLSPIGLPDSSCLPFPNHPLLGAGATGHRMSVVENCAAWRAGWGLRQETLIPGGSLSGRGPRGPWSWLAGPIHQLGCCDIQPCLGVMASPASIAFPRRGSAGLTLLVQCPSQLCSLSP